MAHKKINCPSCGALLELEYRFSEMVVCEFCNQTSHLSGDSLEAVGEKVKLSDYGSKFHVKATGQLQGQNFKVLGRIRYMYPDGFWDEWLINLENEPETEFWLQEDEGDYTLFQKSDLMPSIDDFNELKVGQRYALGDSELFVSEKNTAQIVGGEGELPHRVIPGGQADFVDGIIYGKGIQTSFEFLPNEKQFYTAKGQVKFSDFIFDEKEEADEYAVNY